MILILADAQANVERLLGRMLDDAEAESFRAKLREFYRTKEAL